MGHGSGRQSQVGPGAVWSAFWQAGCEPALWQQGALRRPGQPARQDQEAHGLSEE